MSLYAGIDGGQSSTVVAIANESRTLARGTGPAADLVGETRDSRRRRGALEAALLAALAAARLPADTRFAAIVAGISGFDPGIADAPDLASRADRVRVVHDADIAHAGALNGAPGIVVIAGTGSVALGNAPGSGPFVRAGGWGYFFGDEGSALWIARSAVRRAMARADRAEPSPLDERTAAFFGARDLRQVQHAFAHGELTRAALAAFAGDVLARAEDGDADACTVRDDAALALAELAATVDARLAPASPRRVSYAGGLFRNAAFAERFAGAVAGAIARADVRAPVHDAVDGALALAKTLR